MLSVRYYSEHVFDIMNARKGFVQDGARFVLERDPAQGCNWGGIWALSSVGMAAGLPIVTLFYTFDEATATLHQARL